jgi:poly(3-hydroxybutyrate) depolymerase
MNPDHHAKSHYDYFKDLIKGDDVSTEAHRKFYDEYNAVLDMDADYYLETIKVVFQDFSLVNGTWDVKSPSGKVERVRPSAITNTALMSVEGELDDISGAGQTRAVHEICTGVVSSQQRHFEAAGAGHYGIFSGRRWREMVYPEVKAFIKGHQPVKPAPITETPPAPQNVATPPARKPRAAQVADTQATVMRAEATTPVAAVAPAINAKAAQRTVKKAAATTVKVAELARVAPTVVVDVLAEPELTVAEETPAQASLALETHTVSVPTEPSQASAQSLANAAIKSSTVKVAPAKAKAVSKAPAKKAAKAK